MCRQVWQSSCSGGKAGSPHLLQLSSPLPESPDRLNIEPVLGRGNIASEREGQSDFMATPKLRLTTSYLPTVTWIPRLLGTLVTCHVGFLFVATYWILTIDLWICWTNTMTIQSYKRTFVQKLLLPSELDHADLQYILKQEAAKKLFWVAKYWFWGKVTNSCLL